MRNQVRNQGHPQISPKTLWVSYVFAPDRERHAACRTNFFQNSTNAATSRSSPASTASDASAAPSAAADVPTVASLAEVEVAAVETVSASAARFAPRAASVDLAPSASSSLKRSRLLLPGSDAVRLTPRQNVPRSFTGASEASASANDDAFKRRQNMPRISSMSARGAGSPPGSMISSNSPGCFSSSRSFALRRPRLRPSMKVPSSFNSQSPELFALRLTSLLRLAAA
jgi:hypothetical protein